MSFNLQRLSGASGVVDIARLVRVTSDVFTMQPDDDVVIQQAGNDVLLPDGPPPSNPSLGLQHEILADNLPCTVQGGSHTINGAASLLIPAGNFGIFLWDGTEWVGSLSSGADTDTLAGDVTGPLAANTVIKLQGNPISPAAPALGDVLTWDGAQWVGDLPAEERAAFLLVQSPNIVGGYKSATGLDAFLASGTVTPLISGKFKVRASGAAFNHDIANQQITLIYSHGVAPGAPDFTGSISTAAIACSTGINGAVEYTAPFPLGVPVQFNLGAIVQDPAFGFGVGAGDVQFEIQELLS